MMLLYEFRSSPYCAKIRKVLDYKGLPYETREVNYLTRREPRRLSGQPRVPVLVDDNRVVNDSPRIASYLDASYPERPVIPKEDPLRSRALLMQSWVDEAFALHMIPVKILSPGNAEKMVRESLQAGKPPWWLKILAPVGPALLKARSGRPRLAGRTLEEAKKTYTQSLDLLDGALRDDGYLVGDQPTVADFAAYGFLSTMEGLAGYEEIEPRVRLADWYRRIADL